METESTSDEELRSFAQAARELCAFVENASAIKSVAERLGIARRLLARLVAAGADLPRVEAVSDDSLPWDGTLPDGPDFGPHDLYWEVFDPYVAEETVAGSLSDDLLDIYRDLKRGLVAFDAGQAQDAVWDWRFHFDHHWGDHAVDALRALHRACTAIADAPTSQRQELGGEADRTVGQVAATGRGCGDAMRVPCQALVIRYAPDPSAGEVLNIGVVGLAPAHGFFGARFVDGWQRITQAFPQADLVHLRRVASAVERACAAVSGAQLSLESMDDIVAAFHAIIPPDDASLQHSSALSGVTTDPERTMEELFGRYVTERVATPGREPRRDHEVWREVMSVLRRHGVLDRLQSRTLRGRHYEEQFEAAWRNGAWNVAKPLSLDLLDAHAIVTKAASWTGRIIALEPDKQSTNVHIVVGLPPASAPAEVRRASENGLGLLREKLEDLAAVVPESEVEQLAARIKHDLEHAADD